MAGTGDDGTEREDLPLLGEPLAIELANSLYEGAGETTDFLATPDAVVRWFKAARSADHPHLPQAPCPPDVARLCQLRQVIRTLFVAAVSGARLPAHSVDALNRFADAAPSYARLVRGRDGTCVVATRSSPGIDGLIGRLAHEAIVLVGGSAGALLRRCEAPDCPMLFLKNHHRRRWCHESCGHRSRQAAYYRRHHSAPSRAPSPP